MRKVATIAALITGAVILSGMPAVQTSAAEKPMVRVSYKVEGTETIGIKETTALEIDYPSSTNAEYRWRVDGWCLTEDEQQYVVPEDAEVLQSVEEVTDGDKVTFTFNAEEVYKYALEHGVVPDFDTGEIELYAQPIIRVEKKADIDWQVETSNIRSLEVWRAVCDWKGVSNFKNLYNKKVKVKLPATVEFSAVSREPGGNNSSSKRTRKAQCGQVKTLSEIGLTETVMRGGKKYALYKVRVVGALTSDGTTVDYAAELDGAIAGKSDFLSLTNNSSLVDVNGTTLAAREGYALDYGRSSFYDAIGQMKFRLSENTVIEADYVYIGNTRVTGRRTFYNGVLDSNVIRVGGSKSYTLDSTGAIDFKMNDAELTATASYDGTNKWQLDEISLSEMGETISSDLGETISMQTGEKVHKFSVTKQSTGAWQSAVNNFASVNFKPESGVKDYVVQGKYLLYAPQIELSYYKDADGELHLMKCTSGGKGYNGLDSMKRNVYGVDSSTYEFLRYEEGVKVEGTSRDLVLTEAYAYEGPGYDAVKGYLGDTKNCWSLSSLPTGGKSILASFDASTTSGWKAEDRRSALVEALNGATGGSKTLRVGVGEVPMNPLIYVAIYEACPEVYCMSYVTSDESVNNDTVLTRYNAVDGTIRYDGIDYSMGEKVTVALDTKGLDAYLVYSQDGLDDGIDSKNGRYDDLRGYFSMSDDLRVYCTRYVWLTGNNVNKALGLGTSVTLGQLQNTVGILENSSLGGKLYPKDGKGLLLKVYTPKISGSGIGVWKVNYLDRENGAETNNFSSFKSDYLRLSRAQLTGDYRVVIENSTDTGSFLENVSYESEGTERELAITNTGVSTAGVSYPTDHYGSGGGGYTTNYNSTQADNEYAVGAINQLERNGFQYKVNPYTAGNVGALFLGNYSDWCNQRVDVNTGRNWIWYVYKYAKGYSAASVFEGEETGETGYAVDEGYRYHELNPYTTSYQVSYPTFKENKRTGAVYYLDRIYYGYVDSEPEVITNVEFTRLEGSHSFLHGYRGGCFNCELSKNESSAGTTISITGNTQVYNVDAQQLHVVGVYRLYEAADPVQGEPVVTKEIISYRDTVTGYTNGDTEVGVSSASTNAFDNLTTDARFNASFLADLENSTDDYQPETAIPTTEYERTTASVPKYLVDVDYKKQTMSIDYKFTYYKAFCSKTAGTDKFGNIVINYSGKCAEVYPEVTRIGSNYSLYGATIWYPEDATIRNYSLPESLGQRVTMVGTDAYWLNEEFGITVGDDAEFFFQNFKMDDSLNEMLVCQGIEWVSSVDGSISSYADGSQVADVETRVGPITASNQQVEFNDGENTTTVLLEHLEDAARVDEPRDAPVAENTITALVYANGDSAVGYFDSKNDNTSLPWGVQQGSTKALIVDQVKNNGIYDSSGAVRYCTKSNYVYQHGIKYRDVLHSNNYSAVDNGIIYRLNVPCVKILTPVVATMAITDESSYDQSIRTSVGYPLVLDKVFYVSTSANGSHSGLPGYGTKNYAKYLAETSSRQKAIRVKFPFLVVHVYEQGGETKYDAVRAGQWLTVGLGTSAFILPTFTEESDLQEIQFRAYPCNLTTQEQMTRVEYGMNGNAKVLNGEHNTDSNWNYVAERDLYVATIGRVYDMSIIDIADYPLWEETFRTDDGGLTGQEFHSGLAEASGLFRGNLSDSCFPTVRGNNLKYSNEGYSKTGYKIKFRIETVGSMYSSTDLVRMKPEFYWVDNRGENRTKVDLYYNTERNGEEYRGVKVGSELDNGWLNVVNFSTGEFDVPLDRLRLTAELLGYSEVQDFTTHSSNIYNFTELQLNQYVRTFVGDEHMTEVFGEKVLLNQMVMGDGGLLAVPDSAVERSVQQWYGEYYLPAGIHVTEHSEDEVRSACEIYTYDEKFNGESLWKEDGYLIVNFTITTVNNGREVLRYDADVLNNSNLNEQHYNAGHCDMWATEMRPRIKTSSDGVTFTLENGDFLIYDVTQLSNDNAESNYSGGGTH